VRPILFPSNETAFTSNGLGRLDPISCTVTEERNGQYELEMLVSIDDRHYSDIEEGRLLLARHDDTPDTQPFEIYYISRPLNGQVMVLAHHISYRTATITVMPFEASSITAALLAMKSNSVGDNPFTITTTKSGATPYVVFQPSTLRSLLAGESGSLLDVYGTGEYEWDRFNIRLHLNRGQDTGITLRYGKDITELKKTTDISSIWTGVVPFWLGTDEEENEILVTLPERVIYASMVSNYAYKMIIPLDLTSSFQTAPTVEQLRATAQTYVDNNAVTGIPTSIDVSFVNLAQTKEYENVSALQRLRLCDTITIQHSKLGVAAKAKIIKVVYDVLLERYVSMTVGNVRPDLATTLSAGLKSSVDELKKNSASKSALTSGLAKVSNDVAQIQTSIESEMENVIVGQTEKILGGSGGYIVLKLDADDKPRELLAMNTANMNTATQVLRINENGIGFSSRGINGPYRSAWTLDGVFVADFIQSGTLTATLIRAGILTDVNSNNYWNLETGEFRLAAATTIGGETVADIAEAKAGAAETRANTTAQGYANAAQANAMEATTALNNALTQLEIFNRLTNNGQTQGIYLKNGKLYINATYMDTGTLNADLITAGGLSGTKIADGTISTAKIAAAAITAATLAADAVTAAKIAAGAITAEAIAVGAVGETKIADGAITTIKIAAEAITAAKIAAGAITADAIAVGAVGGTKIANGAITTAKIAAGAITADMITAGSMSANRISGGTLTLGGNNNTNGSITVKNSAGGVIGTIDQNGISMQGTFTTTANSSNVYATFNTSGITWWQKSGEHDGSVGFVDYYNGLFQIRGLTGLTISGDNAWLDLEDSTATFRANLSVTGTKSRVVPTEQYAERLLYCYETASPMFGDIGEGVIGEDGKCYVWLDPVFAQTVETGQYQVFLQRYGEGGLYVAERRGSCFIVAGVPGLAFGWEVKAKQKGFDQKRLDRKEDYPSLASTDYGGSAAQYISQLQEGRIAS